MVYGGIILLLQNADFASEFVYLPTKLVIVVLSASCVLIVVVYVAVAVPILLTELITLTFLAFLFKLLGSNLGSQYFRLCLIAYLLAIHLALGDERVIPFRRGTVITETLAVLFVQLVHLLRGILVAVDKRGERTYLHVDFRLGIGRGIAEGVSTVFQNVHVLRSVLRLVAHGTEQGDNASDYNRYSHGQGCIQCRYSHRQGCRASRCRISACRQHVLRHRHHLLMYDQCRCLDCRYGESCTQCCQGGYELADACNAYHRLRSYGNKRHRPLHKSAELFLDVAQRVLQLLLPSGIRLGKFLVHVSNVGRNDLGKHGSTLTLRTELQYLFLCLVKGDADTLQHFHLSLHRLTHHVADAHGILIGGVQSILLGDEVVHGGDKCVKALLLLQERGHLLGTAQLHLVADYAHFLLGGAKFLDALYIFVGAVHTLPHDGLQLGLCHELHLVGCGKVCHDTLQITDGVLEYINRLRCLRPCEDVALQPLALVLHAPYDPTEFFGIGSNTLRTAVVVDFYYKTDLFCHILIFIVYLCGGYIFEQLMSVNLKPIHDLIVQHPFASVLTVAICLVACFPWK